MLGVLATVTVSVAAPAAALADGDPASDVLATQPTFVPADAGIATSEQARLQALAAAAQRGGAPVRVAIVATRSDLGSVTALWRQPQAYARFLAIELSQVARGALLVVMPGGYGVARLSASATVAPSALAGLPAPAPGAALATAAQRAVQRLAGAAGVRIAPATTRVAPSAPAPSGLPAAAWTALAVGAALIAAAWTLSLRARPLRAR